MSENRPDEWTLPQRPDGWVAYHSDEPVLGVSRRKELCIDNMLDLYFDFKRDRFFGTTAKYVLAREMVLKKAYAKGWRIRPVKLVFLDGGEE